MAVLIITPYQQFFDSNGDPLNGGKVYTYDAGTTTPKATYTDNTEATPLSNPVILDSAGRAVIWGTGTYKFIVKDSLDNTIKTVDNVAMYTAGSGSVIPAANAAGTVDAITADFSPNVTLADKTIVFITSAGANTSTTPTLSTDGNTARTIYKNGATALAAGDIGAAGSGHFFQYDLTNTRWELLNPVVTSPARPTRQYLTSGTSATYTTPANCKKIRVTIIGGGGGGAAQFTNNGADGGDTTFNSIVAKGGKGGTVGTNGGLGGTGGTGSADFRVAGGGGGNAQSNHGGNSTLGGGAASYYSATASATGAANTGGGGAGANNGSTVSGGGGGAGETAIFDIVNPSATYTYTIGAGGNGGAAGTKAGGNGGSGVAIVDEYY